MDSDPELERILRRKAREMVSRGRDAKTPEPQVLTLTSDNFDGYAYSERPLVVDFWAAWCGPCRLMLPIFEEASSLYAGRAVFGRLNVDEHPEIAARHSVFSIPTFIVFRRGLEVDRLVGAVPRREFLQFLASSLG